MKNFTRLSCSQSSGSICGSTVRPLYLRDTAVVFIQFSPDASFSERFYGLKRRRRPYVDTNRALAAVGVVPKQERLRDRDISLSLIFLVRL